MLPLDDPKWKTYKGGYRTPYDASVPLKKLFDEGPGENIWKELWNKLHHQGDVDTAAYASVPYLVEFARLWPKLDWNIFALISVIELQRPGNPSVPTELAASYFQSIKVIPRILVEHPQIDWDENLTRGAVSCIALAKGQREFARVYLEMSLASGLEWLKEEIGYKPSDLIG